MIDSKVKKVIFNLHPLPIQASRQNLPSQTSSCPSSCPVTCTLWRFVSGWGLRNISTLPLQWSCLFCRCCWAQTHHRSWGGWCDASSWTVLCWTSQSQERIIMTLAKLPCTQAMHPGVWKNGNGKLVHFHAVLVHWEPWSYRKIK